MQKEMIEMFTKNSEAAMEAAKKLGDLNLRTMDRLLAQQTELANIYMDITAKSLELFGKAKGVQELVNGQAELTRECGERCMTIMRKGLTLVNESGAEYGVLVSEGVKSAQEQMSDAASSLKAAA
jgi:hypothetical protein